MIFSWACRCALVVMVMTWCAPLQTLQSQAPGTIPGPLPSSEILPYTVEWRLITAGKARIQWKASPAGHGGWQAQVLLQSAGLVSKLFKVSDDYISNLDQKGCAQSSFLSSHEGSRHRETKITFDHDRRKAIYLERDTAKNTVLNSNEIEIPPCVYDITGSLYHLRTLNMEIGQATQIPISDGKKSVSARVECQRREVVKTPAGSFKTIRYEAFLFNNVIYRRPGRVYIWLTDDQRRLPVQIQVRLQLHIGTVTLLLEKEE
ncbi:MAG: DUF3108 domain-containing protein, partial [Bryobacteraceae bacterium]